MVNSKPEISSRQVRAARAWLGWTQEFLASQAGLSKRAVVRAESGSSQPHAETSVRLRTALEAAGLQFRFSNTVGIGIEIAAPSDFDS
ncbi:helix-turn-helix domain-containing protein [Afipia sp. TerB]|jgi:DNA-binding XRE family transcriptional regulator|nr:helix-turn-helix domain-containing protein [Hyphomicrobiales bacterium]